MKYMHRTRFYFNTDSNDLQLELSQLNVMHCGHISLHVFKTFKSNKQTSDKTYRPVLFELSLIDPFDWIDLTENASKQSFAIHWMFNWNWVFSSLECEFKILKKSDSFPFNLTLRWFLNLPFIYLRNHLTNEPNHFIRKPQCTSFF